MAEKISTQKTTSPRRRLSRRTIAILAAAAVVLAAGAIVSVSATRAYAAETTHQCTLALKAGSAAAHSRATAIATADKDLAAVTSTALPGTDGWTSTKYADRPAVKAVKAVPASGGVTAVKAVPARPSGVQFTASVVDARTALVRVKVPTSCTARDEAQTITALAKKSTTAAATLTTRSAALTDDFATFQKDETARVAAEVEAAKKAAEAAAAAKAAAEAAAQQAAARAAAVQRAAAAPRSYSAPAPRSYSGGSTYRAPAPAPAPRPAAPAPSHTGGGSFGVGSGGGGCWTSNGEGGTIQC